MKDIIKEFREEFKDINFHHKGLSCFNDSVLQLAIENFILEELKEQEEYLETQNFNELRGALREQKERLEIQHFNELREAQRLCGLRMTEQETDLFIRKKQALIKQSNFCGELCTKRLAEQRETLLKEKEEEAFKKGYKASTKEAKGAYNWNYSLLQEELEKKVKEKEADYRAEIVKKIEKLEPTRGGNADTFKEQIINIIKSK